MKNQPIPSDVLRSFDALILLINDLTAEAADIKLKFGERSKLLEKKLAQLDTIKTHYNETKKFIEILIDHNGRLGADCIALQLHLTQELHSMNFEQACAVLGLNVSPEIIKANNEVDEIIKQLRGNV